MASSGVNLKTILYTLLYSALLSCIVSCHGSFVWEPIVQNVATYYDPNSGGFRVRAGLEPSLDATTAAIHFMNFYGLKANQLKVPKFINSLQKNGLYSNTQNTPPNVESSLNAIVTLKKLGQKINNALEIQNAIMNLYDNSTGFFSYSMESKPDLKASYFAIQCLLYLNNSQQINQNSEYYEKFQAIINRVSQLDVEMYNFSLLESSDPREKLETFCYFLMLAPLINYTVTNQNFFISYFHDLQNGDGGFSSFPGASDIRESYLVSCAYYDICRQDENNQLCSKMFDRSAYLKFALGKASLLTNLHQAHVSLINFNFLENLLNIQVGYNVLVGSVGSSIVQGTRLKPTIQVAAFDTQLRGLSVESKVDLDGTILDGNSMYWNTNNNLYSVHDDDSFFDTSEMLGQLTHTFYLRMFDGVRLRQFVIKKTLPIGFEISVESRITLNSMDISDNLLVVPNSKLNFAVTLSNTTNKGILTGDFYLSHTLTDSSGAVLSNERIWAVENDEQFEFQYTFNSGAILPGQVTACFNVSTYDAASVHSTEEVKFTSDSVLIGKVENAVLLNNPFIIGRTYELAVKLATAATKNSLIYFDWKNFDSYPKIDLYMYRGTVQEGTSTVIQGTPNLDAMGNLNYLFSWKILPNLDSIGNYQLQLRYLNASNQYCTLQLNQINTAPSDQSVFENKVDFKLIARNVVGTTDVASIKYGDIIKLNFEVFDQISNEQIIGSVEDSKFSVLNVRALVGSENFLLAPVRRMNDNYVVETRMNMKVPPGPVELAIFAEGLGLSPSRLYRSDGTPWNLNVSVEGKIDFSYKIFTKSTPESKLGYIALCFRSSDGSDMSQSTSFVASLINQNNMTVATVPVATNMNPNFKFAYSASFVFPHVYDARSTYTISIRSSAHENSRILFSTKVRYQGVIPYLMFKSESVILTMLVAAFSYFSYKKWLAIAVSQKRKIN